jgi:hypothetical protein
MAIGAAKRVCCILRERRSGCLVEAFPVVGLLLFTAIILVRILTLYSDERTFRRRPVSTQEIGSWNAKPDAAR